MELTNLPPESRQGTVKHIDRKKKYGFIRDDNSRQDLFFHANEVTDNGFDGLQVGSIVSFFAIPDYGKQEGKFKAVDVIPEEVK